MKKKSLFLLVLPLALCALAWGIKAKQDTNPSLILARYPQDQNFHTLREIHLKLHSSGLASPWPLSPRPILVTSYFLGGRTNVIMWGFVDAQWKGHTERQVIDWADQARHDFQWNKQQKAMVRALLKQMPSSEPPKSRDDLLIVSFDDGEQWQTRVYDKKAMPTVVKQVLALMGQKTPLS